MFSNRVAKVWKGIPSLNDYYYVIDNFEITVKTYNLNIR